MAACNSCQSTTASPPAPSGEIRIPYRKSLVVVDKADAVLFSGGVARIQRAGSEYALFRATDMTSRKDLDLYPSREAAIAAAHQRFGIPENAWEDAGRARAERVVSDLKALDDTKTGRRVLQSLDVAAQNSGERVEISGWNVAPDKPYGGQTALRPDLDQKIGQSVDVEQDEDTGRILRSKPGVRAQPSQLTVDYAIDGKPNCVDGSEPAPSYVTLGHELIHAQHMMNGTSLDRYRDPSDPSPHKVDHEESQTIGTGQYSQFPLTENALRREIGIPERYSHGSLCGYSQDHPNEAR